MQEVEDMHLGRNARIKRQLDRTKHGLLVMLEDKRQYLRHLPVAVRTLEDQPLQPLECIRQLGEWCPLAQGTRLALDYCQISSTRAMPGAW